MDCYDLDGGARLFVGLRCVGLWLCCLRLCWVVGLCCCCWVELAWAVTIVAINVHIIIIIIIIISIVISIIIMLPK